MRPVVNAYWGRDRLTLVERADDGGVQSRTVAAEHSCFVLEDALSPDKWDRLRRSAYVQLVSPEPPYRRVVFPDRDAVQAFCRACAKDGVATYEGSISPVVRHMADHSPPFARPRICYLDLEADSRVPFSKKEFARTLCWSVVSEDRSRTFASVLYADTDKRERELYAELWDVLDEFDLVAAWNGDRFDFPVVMARSAEHRLLGGSRDPRRWLWLDHLELFRRMNMSAAESGDEKQSMGLNAVAQSVLGEGKLDFDARRAWEYWAAGGSKRRELQAYNAHDADLMPRIEQKTGYLELLLTTAEACGTFPDSRGINPSVQVEGFLQRLAVQRGHKFPTRLDRPKSDKFKGAWVMEPCCSGITRDVHVCDFSRLYPSVIISLNMSPETYLGNHTDLGEHGGDRACSSGLRDPHSWCPPTTACFATDVEGILPAALVEMLRLRKYWDDRKAAAAPGTPEWKDADRRSAAYKIVANSFYGVIGQASSRFFERAVAESTAQGGVWLIESVIVEAERRGMRCIYGDTDSLFVQGVGRAEFEEFVDWCNKELFPAMLRRVGARSNQVKLTYEKQLDRFIVVTKKRYCNPPEAPILMADFTYKPLGEVAVGDLVMGWEAGDTIRRRKLVPSEVVAVHRHKAEIVKVTMSSGRTLRCTADHQWARARQIVSKRDGKVYAYRWCTPKVGRRLMRVLEPPPPCPFPLDAAWLGGIFDGEGSLSGVTRSQIVISQSRTANPEVCDRIEATLSKLGFRFSVRADGVCNRYTLLGGRQGRLNFWTWCRPARSAELIAGMRGAKFSTAGRGGGSDEDEIVAVEADGHGLVIGMTTTTGNYVAWGYASKNCASYVHFKGKAADADSKPEIKGLEYKRGDSLLMARRMQEEVVDMLVGHKRPPSDRPGDYADVLDRWYDRVARGRLELDDVLVSKGLSKGLDEYARRPLKDGSGFARQLPHIELARELEARGFDVGEGARIDYVVVDARAKPQRVVAAVDWDGSLDRDGLWAAYVFPPTQRLLEAAFPGWNWNAWLDPEVRPPAGAMIGL